MIRASTLTSMSAVILLLAGTSIATLTASGSADLTTANIAPDIVATQDEPLLIEVQMPVAALEGATIRASADLQSSRASRDSRASGKDSRNSRELAQSITMHPDSGVRVISATPATAHRLLLALDVSEARAGKWTLAFGKAFGEKGNCCTATLTVHQTPGPKT